MMFHAPFEFADAPFASSVGNTSASRHRARD
jgi:hypothetical protein